MWLVIVSSSPNAGNWSNTHNSWGFTVKLFTKDRQTSMHIISNGRGQTVYLYSQFLKMCLFSINWLFQQLERFTHKSVVIETSVIVSCQHKFQQLHWALLLRSSTWMLLWPSKNGYNFLFEYINIHKFPMIASSRLSQDFTCNFLFCTSNNLRI